jgi:large subunit ribosomal protein L29
MAKKSNARFEDLKALNDERLAKEMEDAYRQLFSLRLQVATRQLQNVKEIGKVRRKIARVKTLMRQREMVVGGAD